MCPCRHRPVPDDAAGQAGGDDAELAVREPAADGPGDAPGVLPAAAAQVLPAQPHARLPAHRQVPAPGQAPWSI